MKIEKSCLGCIVVCFVIVASISITFPLVEAQVSGTQLSSNVPNAINLSNKVASHSMFPSIATSGNNVYVVFMAPIGTSDLSSTKEVKFYLTKSTDGGVTFGAPTDIEQIPTELWPRIVADGNNVYLAWIAMESNNTSLMISKSTDGGVTFGAPVEIMNDRESGNFNGCSQLYADGNYVYVEWYSSNMTCHITKSTDGGNSFGQPVVVRQTNLQFFVPSDNNLYWIEGNSNNNKVTYFLAKSTDGGTTFGVPVDISNVLLSNVDVNYPSVEIIGASTSNNNLYLSWADYSGAGGPVKVYVAKSTDGGVTFGAPVEIMNDRESGNLLSSGNNVFIVWNHYNIEFEKSTDGGATFSSPVDTGMPRSLPMLSLTAGNNLYWTWAEGDKNASDIFFTTGTSNTTVPEFPFAVPILLISFVSVIVFYRIRKPTIL